MHNCSETRLNLLDSHHDQFSLDHIFSLLDFGGGAGDKGFLVGLCIAEKPCVQ